MEHINVRDLSESQTVEGFYAVQDANLLTTATGKPYIRLMLRDSSGQISGNYWDAGADVFSSFAVGDVIKVRAAVETYRGSLQLKVTALRPAHGSEYEAGLFLPVTPENVPAMRDEVLKTVASIRDADYRRLLEAFFLDPEMMDRFCHAPAAKVNHHACVGGLLEHTVSLVRLAEATLTVRATPLDRDLLLAGALLHDIGKVEELAATTIIDYTDKGRLIGHLVIGSILVQERAKALKDFPDEKLWLVQHMILSHHGTREFGSPVLPAIPEAFALHHIDNFDAKTVAACRMIEEDAQNDRAWTERSWMLDTALYKRAVTRGGGESRPAREAPEPAGEAKSAPRSARPSTGRLF